MIFFIAFLFQTPILFASLLTESIQEFQLEKPKGISAYALSYSGNTNFELLASELKQQNIYLQEVNAVNEKHIPSDLKAKYCSNNVSSYLLAQIHAHLHTYHHCLVHNLPFALILDKNAFPYDTP